MKLKRQTGFDRENITEFLADYLESGLMADDFSKLNPKGRLDLATRLAAYVMPKLKGIDMAVDVSPGDDRSHPLISLLREELNQEKDRK